MLIQGKNIEQQEWRCSVRWSLSSPQNTKYTYIPLISLFKTFQCP